MPITPRRTSGPSCRSSLTASHSLLSQSHQTAQQRQQEVALQRILEEEILQEMARESALQEVGLAWP